MSASGDSLLLEVPDRLGDPHPPELRPSAREFKASCSMEIALENREGKKTNETNVGWIRVAWDETASVYVKAEAAARLYESSVHR